MTLENEGVEAEDTPHRERPKDPATVPAIAR
jgi:hypothetical protein